MLAEFVVTLTIKKSKNAQKQLCVFIGPCRDEPRRNIL